MKLSKEDIIRLKEIQGNYIKELNELTKKEFDHEGMRITLVKALTDLYFQNEMIEKIIKVFELYENKEGEK